MTRERGARRARTRTGSADDRSSHSGIPATTASSGAVVTIGRAARRPPVGHSWFGPVWYSNTSPPTAISRAIRASTSSQMWKNASASPHSAAEAASPIGQ